MGSCPTASLREADAARDHHFRTPGIYTLAMSSGGYNPATQLDFETPVIEIERQIETLEAMVCQAKV